MPKGVPMLVKSIVKQIPEDSIDETLDYALQFLGAAYVELEKIRAFEEIGGAQTRDDLISTDAETQVVVEFEKRKTA